MKIIQVIKIILMIVLVNINHFSTAGSTLEPALSFKRKDDGEVKPRLTIAERINSIPEDKFQVCGGIRKNNKFLNTPKAKTGRILNDNDNIQAIESKSKYKYIFQDVFNTKKISNKYTDKSKFRTHWAYPKRPEARNGKSMKSFKTVACNEIIIDIDANKNKNPDNINLEGALKISQDIIDILLGFNINVTAYYSGLKGFHIAISLPCHYEFNTLDIGKTDNIVLFYHNLIDYLNDKLNDIPDNVDLDYKLQEVSRLIQLRNRKKDNDNGRGYKICIGSNKDICTDINRIREASQNNKDLGKALRNNKNNITEFIKFLKELQDKGYTEKQENTNKIFDIKTGDTTNDLQSTLQSVLNPLLNELNKIHTSHGHENIRAPLMYTCKAYTNDFDNVKPIIDILIADERHGDTTNNINKSLKNAFINGKANKWALWNKLELLSREECDKLDKRKPENKEIIETNTTRKALLENFCHAFEVIVKENEIESGRKEYQEILKTYENDIISIYDDKILDYKNNSENLFYGVLYSLSTGLGLSSQEALINDLAGTGKTKYKEELFKIIPNSLNIGTLSEKALYYITESMIDCKVIYCNDKGLETEKQKEETQSVRGLIREAITDGRIVRQKVNNDNTGVDTLITEVDAISLITTELHTEEGYKTGEQFTSVREIININPLNYDDYLEIQLIMQDPENKKKVKHFKQIHKNYLQYLITHYNEPVLTKATLRGITDSRYTHRENTRRIAFYKTYCHYFNYDVNDMHSIKKWNSFYQHNELPSKVLEVYEVIKTYFTPVDIETFDGLHYEHQLKESPIKNKEGVYVRSKNGKTLHFFTINNMKSYLNPLKHKKGKLFKYRDNISAILQQLVKHGLINEISTGEERNLYYIPKEDHR